MLDLKKLTNNDVGKFVLYKTPFKRQKGRIKSWNDKWIFVVYNCAGEWENYRNYTANATDPKDLFWY